MKSQSSECTYTTFLRSKTYQVQTAIIRGFFDVGSYHHFNLRLPSCRHHLGHSFVTLLGYTTVLRMSGPSEPKKPASLSCNECRRSKLKCDRFGHHPGRERLETDLYSLESFLAKLAYDEDVQTSVQVRVDSA